LFRHLKESLSQVLVVVECILEVLTQEGQSNLVQCLGIGSFDLGSE
jgi:hypothetical protein